MFPNCYCIYLFTTLRTSRFPFSKENFRDFLSLTEKKLTYMKCKTMHWILFEKSYLKYTLTAIKLRKVKSIMKSCQVGKQHKRLHYHFYVITYMVVTLRGSGFASGATVTVPGCGVASRSLSSVLFNTGG